MNGEREREKKKGVLCKLWLLFFVNKMVAQKTYKIKISVECGLVLLPLRLARDSKNGHKAW